MNSSNDDPVAIAADRDRRLREYYLSRGDKTESDWKEIKACPTKYQRVMDWVKANQSWVFSKEGKNGSSD